MRSLIRENHDRTPIETEALDLEGQMRTVSQVVSAAAVVLMLAGLSGSVLAGSALALPGGSVIPVRDLLQLHVHPLGLAAMSGGVLMLALLPIIRVLLALGIYSRQRVPINALAALVVLVELLIGMRAGSG